MHNQRVTTISEAVQWSPLFDKTIVWHSDLPHLWLDYGSGIGDSAIHHPVDKPSVMLVLTNYAWNQKNQRKALRYARSIRSTELLQGLVDHPLFHPTAYQEIMDGTRQVDPTVTYYTFLDVETCYESNYPNYRKGYKGNCNTFLGRKKYSNLRTKRFATCYDFENCWNIPHALKTSPLFTTHANSSAYNKLVVFDCRGNGQKSFFETNFQTSDQLALVTLSSLSTQIQPSIDQGLPPPANKPVKLSPLEREQISTCKSEAKRPFLLTFSGDYKRHDVRKELSKLDTIGTSTAGDANARLAVVADMINRTSPSNFANNTNAVLVTDSKNLHHVTPYSYQQVMVQSKFVAVPRGDNPFSYRFTEALSAGAIPVVLADDWVLPFRQELVQWEKCVVSVPEKNVANTVTIVSAMDDETRCLRRQYCYHIYQTYMQTSQGTLHGIVESLRSIKQAMK